jgi:transposase
MGRRVFTAEFKHEATKLVLERGMKVMQAAKDLGIHETVLRKWVTDARRNGKAAFPGRGKQRPDDAEVARLRPLSSRVRSSALLDPRQPIPRALAVVHDCQDLNSTRNFPINY